MKNLLSSKKSRIVGVFGTVSIAASLAVVGVTTTGAYFSDAKQGNLSGTVGSIKIIGSGGDGTNNLALNYENLLPGAAKTATLNYSNTGTSPEDVWIVFNNADALHALNDLGTYGEFHIAANGTALFDSANLNDDANGTCGPLSPAGCWPVPKMVKLASNVGPGSGGTASFTFAYASKLSSQPTAGNAGWNAYPLAAPTASGLPYQLVATQAGQTP